jgi:hypothetical protein
MNCEPNFSHDKLPLGERLARTGRIVLDAIVRGLPCAGGLPPIETEFHSLREQIAALETMANAPRDPR